MENKPTIREEFIDKYLCLYDTDMSGFGTNLIDEIADWWLNKIKEVVENWEYQYTNYPTMMATKKATERGYLAREIKADLLKEFGIIK